jgi:YebC/PmpR family DNA-binding regulatory protein
MAGHSHWANIQHKKGAADAKRGKLFSKLSRVIMIAARSGGGDPDMNLKLRYAIDKARQYSMPKENIERAVKKGTGESGADQMEEIVYEGYGPNGVAVMVEVLTDNRNRAAGEIRKIFEKTGSHLGTSGCVAYLFERKGLLTVDASKIDEDTLMGIVLEAGCEDLKKTGDSFELTCDPTAFGQVKEALETNSLIPGMAEITQIPKTQVDVDVETGRKILRLMDALDDHEDVQNVHTNANFTEEMMAAMQE